MAGGYGEKRAFNVKLIAAVQTRAPLWDVRLKDHKNNALIGELWNEIAEELKTTVEEVMKKFKNIRDTYVKEYRKVKNSAISGKEGFEIYQPTWSYFDRLQFLKDTVDCRRTSGNFNKHAQAEVMNECIVELVEDNLNTSSTFEPTENFCNNSSQLNTSKLFSQVADTAQSKKRNFEDAFLQQFEIFNKHDETFQNNLQNLQPQYTGNQLFALSLVRHLDRVPEQLQGQCQIALLQTVLSFINNDE